MIKMLSNPKLRSPVLICAWPGMGEVAIRAAMHLKEAVPFKEFAKLDAPDYFEPVGVNIKNGVLDLPDPSGGTFYYYKHPKKTNDIILFISDAQPNTGSGILYAEEIIGFAKKHGAGFIYTFAALTIPIEHTNPSRVWAVGTSKKIIHALKGQNIKLLTGGQVSGLNGLVLGVAKNHGLDGVCLLGEIPIYTIQIENPKASLAVLEILDKNIGLDIDLTTLKDRAKFIEEEINKLVGYIKGEAPPGGPLSEEDIEKIKKELAAFTKLPESARKKIEELFRLASEDVAKAVDLKRELDIWSVFKEYEDRFLDLFRKKKN